ncbi:hypothetical protein F4810DRAFT_375980 [Camillea tinctor]|nr:hypothetical protein F4810DRAFT_375980 [Camillea tinctor]
MASELITNTYGVTLPDRYEIRRLGTDVEKWTRAMGAYSSMFNSKLFEPLYRDKQPAKRVLEDYLKRPASYLPDLKSGLSYGIYDKKYRFKRPESYATGGAVYWDELDPNDPELEGPSGRQKLLDGMDFPLVSVAYSHDGSEPMSRETKAQLGEFVPELLPLITQVGILMASSSPDAIVPLSDQTKPPGEVLSRGGTHTREGYTGQGLMKALAHFLMHEAQARGYQKIQIGTSHEKVHQVWLHPPAPFRATIDVEFDPREMEFPVVEGGREKMEKLFAECPLEIFSNITVHLQDIKCGEEGED